MDHWKEYYKMWDFKSADDFARHDVDGHLFWGCVKKYDEEWKKAAEERGYDYLFVKFEDIIRYWLNVENLRHIREFKTIW